MGMNSEKGEWSEVWWNWKNRMEIADTHLKIKFKIQDVYIEKLKHYIVL